MMQPLGKKTYQEEGSKGPFRWRNWISERPDLPDHIAVSQIKTGVSYKSYSVIHFMCDAESHL